MRTAHAAVALSILLGEASLGQTPLPTGQSVRFSGSGNCVLCHQGAGGEANMWKGKDVSTITDWRATMMGNASKDPFWRAMVAEEVHRFPSRKDVIESTCTRCHSPIGFTEAIASGKPGYSMAELERDPLANDGVSCTVCHQITPDGLGSPASYSGHFTIGTDRLAYGPYDDSDTTLMPVVVNYTSRFSAHISSSELCATCHTLFTPVLDAQGDPTGSFPEQTPYLEWKNSIYPVRGTQCQDCHMPALPDSIKISGMGNFPKRAPYSRHEFVGGNVYMLSLLRDNIDSLAVTASPAHFDSTIARAARSLTDRSLRLEASAAYVGDTLEIRATLTNLTGHKLPTGIPFRRMWLHTLVTTGAGDTLFESGGWERSGRLTTRTLPFEPHHRTITSPGQVQIYEAVIGDADSAVTRSLLRAAHYLKDNRIPPAGFTRSHPAYDSTAIAGEAENDPDFNRDGTAEGTGSDQVTYRILAPGVTAFTATVEVCYQSVNPELVEEIRGLPPRDIARFVRMYDELPNTPFVMKRVTLDVVTGATETATLPEAFRLEQNYPNPFNPSTEIRFSVPASPGPDARAAASGLDEVRLSVYDILGHEVAVLVHERMAPGEYTASFNASGFPSGVYLYRLAAGEHVAARKMLLVR